MARYAMYAAFAGVMLPVSMLPGYYVAYHLVSFFGLQPGLLFWGLVVLLGLLLLGGMGMAAVSDDPRLRGVNIALGVWAGFFFILVFLLLLFDIVTVFYAWSDYRLAGQAVLVLAAVLSAAGAVNARFVRLRMVKVPAPGLKKPVRIALLSDLHLGPVNGLEYFKRIIERTNKEKPDIVLLAGDIIDGRLTEKMFAPINDLKAPVYFSPGNHEHYAGMEDFLEHLARTKAEALVNRKVDLGGVELAGIDFDWSSKAFAGMIEKVRPSGGKYSVLMSHGPPAFDAAARAGFDLTLAGHTHGGQLWPFTAFGRLFVRYRAGMYEREGKRLFVTTGTGTWGPPIRLGTSSELTIVDIG